jgi:hypothetical protein
MYKWDRPTRRGGRTLFGLRSASVVLGALLVCLLLVLIKNQAWAFFTRRQASPSELLEQNSWVSTLPKREKQKCTADIEEECEVAPNR